MECFQGPFSTFKLQQDKDCDWTGLKFSPDGKLILISTNGTVIRLIDAFQGTPLQTFMVSCRYTVQTPTDLHTLNEPCVDIKNSTETISCWQRRCRVQTVPKQLSPHFNMEYHNRPYSYTYIDPNAMVTQNASQ